MRAAASRSAEKPSLADARRLVVKIGSALLVDDDSGDIRRAWLDGLADDVAALKQRGVEVLIVSSGAIAVGRRHLGLTQKALKLEEKQAAAATGQIRLAHAYQETLARHGITAAETAAPARNPKDPSSWGKVGRNEACPCGSGKKYKHCHGRFA